MSTTALSKQQHRTLTSTATHLLGDLLLEWDGEIQAPDAFSELHEALPKADITPPDDAFSTQSVSGYFDEEVATEITVTTSEDNDTSLDAAFASAATITAVEYVRARPSSLPALGELQTGDADAEKATADFTIIGGIGQEKADCIAEAGFQTWDEITKADQSEIESIPMVGTAAAKDLAAEASTRADITTIQAIEAADRVASRRTTSAGRGITHDLNTVAEPPGSQVTPPEANNYHGWPVLEDIDHPHVPNDPGPVVTQTTLTGEDELALMAKLLSKGRNVMLIGPPGTGKNVRIRKLFHETNRPLVTIPMDEDTMIQELMGNFTVGDDGDLTFEDALLPIIVKNGGGLCLDEPNAAPKRVLRALYKILEDDASLYVKGSNEIIEPHPEFYVLSTINPADLGAGPLPSSFARRFNKLPIDTLAPQQEATLLDQKVNQDRTLVAKDALEGLTNAASALRDRAQEGERVPYITTGELINVCHAADGADGTADQTALMGALQLEVQGAQLATIGGQQMGSVFDDEGLEDLMTGHAP